MQFMFYKQQPDSHPNFKNEWHYYWCKRHAENNLSNVGNDFKELWLLKLDEIEREEMLKAKVRLRQKLKMPIEEADSNELILIERRVKSKSLWLEDYFKKISTQNSMNTSMIKNKNSNEVQVKQEIIEIKKEKLETQNSNCSVDTIVGDTGCETPDSDDLVSNHSNDTIVDKLDMSFETIPEIEYMNPEEGAEISHQESRATKNFANFEKPPVMRVIIDPNEVFEEFNKKYRLSSSSVSTYYPSPSESSNQLMTSSNASISSNSDRISNKDTSNDSDDHIDGFSFKDVLFLYNNVDKMRNEDRKAFYEKLSKFKRDYPARYQRLVQMHEEIVSNQQKIMMDTQEEDDYDMTELAKILKIKNQNAEVSFDEPPEIKIEDFLSAPITYQCTQSDINKENIIDLTGDD